MIAQNLSLTDIDLIIDRSPPHNEHAQIDRKIARSKIQRSFQCTPFPRNGHKWCGTKAGKIPSKLGKDIKYIKQIKSVGNP